MKTLWVTVLVAGAVTSLTTLNDFFLPGSQIGQSGNIETPDKCDNCHGGYNNAVEPAFNWRGSMMSQAARDPLFYACLAVANQDAPDVGDMCLRCHTPDGWLNGRCVPTDGSALNNNDRQGVQCDFCHKMVKPTELGVNPYPGNPYYTSMAYGSGTYSKDQAYLSQIIPIPGTTANGMYLADANNAKRGPFTDAVGRHQMLYSPFHSQSDFCGTCHDVSNPVFTKATTSDAHYLPNSMGQPSETFDLRLMFPVERTYSEWLSSGFNSTDPLQLKTCQDCHMKDVTGKGAKMNDAPVRDNLPLHDMTGGNTFVPRMVKQAYASEVNAQALDAGIARARNMLQSAATIDLSVSGSTAIVKVTNKTGHKLPSGYPEGRRMWVNMKFFDAAGNLVGESGAYDLGTAELTKTGTKIYECKPAISQTVADALNPLRPPNRQLIPGPSFHMAINNEVYFDNRIPPPGFTNAKLNEYQSPVIGATYADGQNFDITNYAMPAGAVKVEARLYYQTASKEYIEFLRDENYTNTKGQELYNLWMAHGKSTPELMCSATWPVQQNVMTSSIQSVLRVSNKQGITYASAIVLVQSNNLPLAGAQITASYSGPTNGTVTGTTGTDGKVTLKSATLKSPVGQWCFTVTNVVKSGYTFSGPGTMQCEGTAGKGGFITATEEDDLSGIEYGVKVFPNPFNSQTNFSVSSPKQEKLLVELFDLAGKRIAVICNKDIPAGRNMMVSYQPVGLASGTYIYAVSIGRKKFTGKLLYNK